MSEKHAKVAFVAPGQGIEDWSLGLRLAEQSPRVLEVYEKVYDATGVDIIEVCRATEPITNTSVAQPAALGIGYAHAEILQHEQGIKPDYLIGLSAGEFTVAAISRAISLADAAQIAQRRGILQNEAAGGLGGGITAIHKRPLDLKSLTHELGGYYKANSISPNLTGFGYLHAHKAELVEKLKAQGAKVLDVKNLDFPPHGPHVKVAQDKLAALLGRRGVVGNADISIIAIRTARAMKKARTIRHNLIWQTTQPTKLNEAIRYAIKNGVESFYDLGPDDKISKVLGGLAAADTFRLNPVAI